MKRLLHSKRFRKNLCKWVFMYIGVIVLFTTVITYSKYVSQLMSAEDSARVAKFQVYVEANKPCGSSGATSYCNPTGTIRPTAEISYYFTVRTDLEVKTDLYLTAILNKRFTLIKLEEVGNSATISTESKDHNISIGDRIETYTASTWKVGTIEAAQNIEKIYKITIKFNPLNEKDYSNVTANMDYDILRVGYSATQIQK